MNDLIQLDKEFIRSFSVLLPVDKTTRESIAFATDSYANQGEYYAPEHEITPELLPYMDLKPSMIS